MKPLWTPQGRAALDDLLSGPALLAFDFDGTLAPIVPRPDDARVPTALAHRLRLLAERLPVAVVTGRAVEDVRERLGFTPHRVVGSHGVETDDQARNAAWAEGLQPLREHLAHQGERLREAGVQVEDKRLSMALHYRLAPDRARAAALIEAVLAQAGPERFHRFGGKCVENVVVAGAPDKGDAVVQLMGEFAVQRLLFVGDDVNDEAVFRRAGPRWLTLRIGCEVASSARFCLPAQADLAQVLDALLRAAG